MTEWQGRKRVFQFGCRDRDRVSNKNCVSRASAPVICSNKKLTPLIQSYLACTRSSSLNSVNKKTTTTKTTEHFGYYSKNYPIVWNDAMLQCIFFITCVLPKPSSTTYYHYCFLSYEVSILLFAIFVTLNPFRLHCSFTFAHQSSASVCFKKVIVNLVCLYVHWIA